RLEISQQTLANNADRYIEYYDLAGGGHDRVGFASYPIVSATRPTSTTRAFADNLARSIKEPTNMYWFDIAAPKPPAKRSADEFMLGFWLEWARLLAVRKPTRNPLGSGKF